MKKKITIGILVTLCNCAFAQKATFSPSAAESQNGNVCVDTHLSVKFSSAPILGNKGWVRIYDAKTDAIVDSLDISKPAGLTESRTYGNDCDYLHTGYSYVRNSMATNRTAKPGTPSHPAAEPTSDEYQLNIIGGFTDGFHFHPIIAKEDRAVIYLHNNMLDYGREYYVTIDKSVFLNKGFRGVTKKDKWCFTTKQKDTSIKHTGSQNDTIRVNANGSADFCTVQGALDNIADFSPRTTVVLVAEGDYEEIVYARNKTNVKIQGAGMKATKVHYANNEVFNPHPLKVKTNELQGTFPSRRAAFMLDNCANITMQDICVATDLKGQAEGLLVNGERVALRRVHIIGDGDALQANGTVYLEDCQLDGGWDAILGRGSVYAYHTDFRNGGGPFTWVRNTMGVHGDVFVECTFSSPDGTQCDYGRTPMNKKAIYPHAEIVVIDCRVRNLASSGWMEIGEPTSNMLEFNTRDLDTGKPVDVSKRSPYSRQLDAVKDAEIIDCYRTPAFVLKGWNPNE